VLSIEKIFQEIQSLAADKISGHELFRGDLTIVVKPAQLLDLVQLLRNSHELAFLLLVDITAVDYGNKQAERFAVIYHLYSQKLNAYLRLKSPVSEQSLQIPTLTSLWRAADWLERETFDMFGIEFVGHPNLKRILMTDSMQGFPLRKDFPLHGPPEWPIQEEFKHRVKPHGS
jgi:NADH-quinone oxidoreductase subunit C